ncbi:unnamed protein product [Meloidogyne enterolobii]|uniref:Uncharacterized protein n=1 Tax=Meloidogyne enterolobii TaxID=390850 RepID=A0ACB0XTT0_MELEN
MPPLNVSTPQQFRQNGKMTEEDEMFLTMEVNDLKELEEKAKAAKFKTQVVWRNVGLYVLLQTGATIGLYQLFFTAKWLSVAWVIILWMVSGVGITAGPHRLWSHKSYKAKTPLKIILMFMNCVAFQNDVIEWSRDHRCHHKWTDTDADPYYLPLVFIFCFLLPTATAVFLWGESVWIAFCTAALFRYCLNLHATWFINSAAHTFGYKPYDVAIKATESMLTTLTAWGEGGHNYHHTFPQDYRTSEMLGVFNFSRLFIDFFAKIGWAYDLKTVDEKTIQRQMGRQLERLKEEEKKNSRAA